MPTVSNSVGKIKGFEGYVFSRPSHRSKAFEGFGRARSVMIPQVFHVAPLTQCILRDDVEIATVEGRIALVFGRLRALAKNHVSRNEASGIGASDQ